MIGDKLLKEPITDTDIKVIFNDFGMYLADEDEESNYENAKRLVELNNEVYEKLHNASWLNYQAVNLRINEMQNSCDKLEKKSPTD